MCPGSPRPLHVPLDVILEGMGPLVSTPSPCRQPRPIESPVPFPARNRVGGARNPSPLLASADLVQGLREKGQRGPLCTLALTGAQRHPRLHSTREDLSHLGLSTAQPGPTAAALAAGAGACEVTGQSRGADPAVGSLLAFCSSSSSSSCSPLVEPMFVECHVSAGGQV